MFVEWVCVCVVWCVWGGWGWVVRGGGVWGRVVGLGLLPGLVAIGAGEFVDFRHVVVGERGHVDETRVMSLLRARTGG